MSLNDNEPPHKTGPALAIAMVIGLAMAVILFVIGLYKLPDAIGWFLG